MAETIAVFGATGATGSHVVKVALEKGYKVQAMARSPSKIKVKDTNLTVIQGDFENIDAIRTTVKDADYVICCAAGNLKEKPYKMIMGPFVERLWPILEANTSTKVFLYQAGMLSPKPGETLSLGMRTMKGIFGCLVGGLGPMIADNDSVIEFMASKKSTPFSVIVTRPGNLKEAESTGVPLKGSDSAPSMSPITFKDLAVFSVEAIKNESLYGTYPYPVPQS